MKGCDFSLWMIGLGKWKCSCVGVEIGTAAFPVLNNAKITVNFSIES